ncbi:hypothetical protein ACFOMD_02785 [Sphingoaurantiacus capsulatus]|uniref:Uncharacterized protein n=1 Tax=Sphingoaurantiacus capsulatus TaxID=1771310 RepID=A0ABV7XA06_9SPHN
MLETTNLLVLTGSSIVAIAMLGMVWAWSWKGWLEFKRQQLTTGTGVADEAMPVAQVGNRIELADLRERVKKLEAIAAGVDL